MSVLSAEPVDNILITKLANEVAAKITPIIETLSGQIQKLSEELSEARVKICDLENALRGVLESTTSEAKSTSVAPKIAPKVAPKSTTSKKGKAEQAPQCNGVTVGGPHTGVRCPARPRKLKNGTPPLFCAKHAKQLGLNVPKDSSMALPDPKCALLQNMQEKAVEAGLVEVAARLAELLEELGGVPEEAKPVKGKAPAKAPAKTTKAGAATVNQLVAAKSAGMKVVNSRNGIKYIQSPAECAGLVVLPEIDGKKTAKVTIIGTFIRAEDKIDPKVSPAHEKFIQSKGWDLQLPEIVEEEEEVEIDDEEEEEEVEIELDDEEEEEVEIEEEEE